MFLFCSCLDCKVQLAIRNRLLTTAREQLPPLPITASAIATFDSRRLTNLHAGFKGNLRARYRKRM
jgi:hypothetical protein